MKKTGSQVTIAMDGPAGVWEKHGSSMHRRKTRIALPRFWSNVPSGDPVGNTGRTGGG